MSYVLKFSHKWNDCDKAFYKPSAIIAYENIHKGKNPHECDQCPKTFRNKGHLNTHKTIYTGKRLFKCYQCFKQKYSTSSEMV